jgi:hypothetical protein
LAKRCEEGPLWDEWSNYFKTLNNDIRETCKNILTHEPKVFLIRKNRHIVKTKGLFYRRYVALDEKDIEPVNDFSKDRLKEKLFTADIFGEGFLSPGYKLDDLMEIVLLKNYFSTIDDANIYQYVGLVRSLTDDPNFEHYCDPKAAKTFSDLIKNHIKTNQLKIKDYRAAIKYFEKESLLTGYEDGISIMIPISVGAYYTMSVFLSFKENFIGIKKSCKFMRAKFTDKKIRSKLIQLYNYLNQIPMLMLTKLYSLFPKYEPTIGVEELLKKGLSLILCVPEGVIDISKIISPPVEIQENNVIEIILQGRKIIIPYHGDAKFKTITTAQVREIADKVYELHQNIEKLGKEKGASVIGASVAHNLRNILPGFTNVIESFRNEYPRLFIQGHAVENRINWLNILNPKVNLTERVTSDLIKILLSSFNSAWLLILLRGEIVKGVDLVDKFKKNSTILYPVLRMKTLSDNSYHFVALSFVTETRKVSFLEHSKWGDCNVPNFNEVYYRQFNSLYKYWFKNSALIITDMEENTVTLEKQNLSIPKEAIAV